MKSIWVRKRMRVHQHCEETSVYAQFFLLSSIFFSRFRWFDRVLELIELTLDPPLLPITLNVETLPHRDIKIPFVFVQSFVRNSPKCLHFGRKHSFRKCNKLIRSTASKFNLYRDHMFYCWCLGIFLTHTFKF